MDDLMRKAGEEYPLNPPDSDWEKVSHQLHRREKFAFRNRNKYLVFILFLAACLAGTKYLYNHSGPSDISVNSPQRQVDKNTRPSNEIQSRTGAAAPVKTTTSYKSHRKSEETTTHNKTRSTYTLKKPDNKVQKLLQNKDVSVLQEEGDSTPNILQKSQKEIAAIETDSDVKPNQVTDMGIEKVMEPQKETEAPKIGMENSEKEVGKPSAAKLLKQKSKLYLTMLLGPDVSTVKFQKVKGVGYSIGVTAGYTFGKHFAAEAGIIWDRKKYYTDGSLFKTDKIQLPSHSNILQASGYCDMLEIPINIRLNFSSGKKNNWYALTGFSSYLMQKEEYDYEYERYNVLYNSNKYYRNASQHWFSVVNLGVGYERQLGRSAKIRFEPYIKLPLREMGVGSLPLSSTGMYVGVTYPIIR
ncbi:MAG: outer membrane beta-barrel protein [Chitinophagaceae bacterium]